MSRPTSSGIASSPRHMRSRTQSISSDRPSVIGHSLMSPPLTVSPEAAFIAASAASQIVTNDHDSHADTWYDQHGIEPAGETAMVSPAALQLVNNFLDQLLFNFLLVSRATTLVALRPAVSEVLKPKLAKDAINQADEELREYLGGGDEDDFIQAHGADPSQDWDLELVWKRTRLRCMVYSSLGDMEEEDEDYYMEQENLGAGADEQSAEVISPAVAIFLTSILEFMGEQALVVAGQAAYHRMRLKFEKDLKEGIRGPADVADRIVVEELDMERVALDRTLGRLWRAWKKRIRSPGTDPIRPFSRDSNRGHHLRQGSNASEHPLPTRRPGDMETNKKGTKQLEEEVSEEIMAAAIPLPMGDRDIDEIEVPGLVAYSDDEEDDETEVEEAPRRPKSLMIFPPTILAGLPTPSTSQPQTPVLPPRKRSNSLPTPALSPYMSPIKRAKVEASDKAADTGDAADATTKDDAPRAKSAPKGSKNQAKRLSKIVTTAAATRRAAREDDLEASGDEGDEDLGEFEILTTSRVSVGGRSSPAVSESGKTLSISSSGPARSPSVQSARLIDVAGPKSPVLSTRSRTPSLDSKERVRPSSLSQASSISQSPIVEEHRVPRAVDTVIRSTPSPAARSPVERAPRSGRQNAISELEEEAEGLSARTPTTATLSTPTSATIPPEELQSQIKSANALFGSVMRGHPPPSSPQQEEAQPSTKVTILSHSNSNGPFVEDSPPEVPLKSPHHARSQAPNVRDRTSSRQVNGAHSPATSIGVVSVERPEETAIASSAIAPRQIHTSGSTGSTGTRYKPVRKSEESGGKNAESVARNFEELIHSDQTITYTLTPETMRDLEASLLCDSRPRGGADSVQQSSRSANDGSPVIPGKARRSEDAKSVAERARSSSNADLKRSTSVRGPTGLNSHPVHIPQQSPTKLTGPVPKAPATMGGQKRANVPQARDARVPRESVMDFAEFIRTTGPPGGENRPTPRGLNGPIPSSKMVVDGQRVSVSRPRLQARDAAVDGKEDNSDLIDFIRRGPPNASGNPRIPRTVAPFRTTMDSDQMSGAVGGKAVDATLPDIRYSQASASINDAPSMHSSINSQSALLKNRGGQQNGNPFDDDDMMPKRKTRRVKDPYAIDFSDEEGEDDYSTPKPPQKEESLADFLKNYQPPPDTSETVPFDLPGRPKKKASAPSLMGRLGRGTTSANGAGMNGSDSRPVSSRTGSGRGYIPIQVNMPPGYDKYGPIDTATTSTSSETTTRRVPMKKFEPRDPISTGTRTSDLAAFLRNSEPPASMMTPATYSPTEDDGNYKVFGRRKKSAMT